MCLHLPTTLTDISAAGTKSIRRVRRWTKMNIIPPQGWWRVAFDIEEWHVSIQKLLKAPPPAQTGMWTLVAAPYNRLRPNISPIPPPPDSEEMRTVNIIVDSRGWRQAQLARIESIVSAYQSSNSGPLIMEAREIRPAAEDVILSAGPSCTWFSLYYYINNFLGT
jgi:hypothetical protein